MTIFLLRFWISELIILISFYHWCIFSSVHSNNLIFLLQSFQHLSIEHQWGRLSWNHYVSLYLLSQLVSCFLVCRFCTFVFVPLVLISRDFWKILPVFWILFKKISLPIKCPFWLKISFIYFKSFLLRLDIINRCIDVITKKPFWRYWHILC